MSLSFNIVDLFCGAGGLSLGFKKAGFNTVYAADNDKKAIETFKNNLGGVAEVADVFDLTADNIIKKANISSEIDIIVGGPPCQGFSVQRRGSDHDERNFLVLEFARIVHEACPKIFVMENVSGLLSKRGESVLEEFKTKLGGEYALHIQKLDASHYGVPQSRKRVFLVGVKTQFTSSEFVFPSAVISDSISKKTVREFIYDLQSKDESDVPNHKADKLSDINLERIRSITQGQGRDSLPEHLQLPCHRNNANHRHLDTYGRMSWDNLAPTITARFDSFSRGRFGHPVLDRTITLREGARLQTFPDEFVFVGAKVEVARQIGNAVPPQLAFNLASSIKEFMVKNYHIKQGNEAA